MIIDVFKTLTGNLSRSKKEPDTKTTGSTLMTILNLRYVKTKYFIFVTDRVNK